MNISARAPFRSVLLALSALVAGALVLGTTAARAAVGAVSQVIYSPTIKEVQGQIPYGETYPLTITSPSNLPTGSNVTVAFDAIINGFLPSGATVADALSYVRFSQNSLTFTGPNQTQTVTVFFAVPATAVPGQYGYQIKTIGWPASPSATNEGTSINATVSLAPVPNPPAVTINTPADGSEIVITPPANLPIDVPFTFVASSTGTNSSAITAVDADVDGTPITLTTTGINTLSVSGSGTLRIATLGSHVVKARATNAGGTANDVNTFVVKVSIPPPAVVINTPLNGSTYTYRVGGSPVTVPLTFVGSTTGGGIRTLSAKLDGQPITISSSNLLTLVATGGANLAMDADDDGAHRIDVEAVDIYGQIATATTEFTVEVLEPTPTISISNPTPGQVFTLPTGATTMNIPYQFVTNTTTGFTISSVSAALGSVTLSPSTTGLGTATATSTGTMNGLGVGTYTLTASGVSGGKTVTASVQFSVRAGALVPPSVVINTPAVGATYTLNTGSTLSIPLTFTGTSNNSSTVITAVTAKLGSTNLNVSATLNQKVVNASATMNVSAAGTYTINVTATDAVGTATATRSFTVTVVTPRKVCGFVFFDLDRDGRYDCEEFGLSAVTVRLTNASGQVVASDATNACGYYTIYNVAPGTYTVAPVAPTGMTVTTGVRTITVANSNVTASPIGLALDFNALRAMRAEGKSHGFWKMNLDKAISGKTGGTQVSASAMSCYTKAIGDFALSVYDNISMKSAASILGSNSNQAKNLLSKQLIASEYNYQHGAYIGGNRTLTFLFLYWGEQVLRNSSSYSTDYLVWAKDWFDAYNNSYGGLVDGPRP